MVKQSLKAILTLLLVSRELTAAAVPLVVGTWDYIEAISSCWANLQNNNGTALSSVVTGIEWCELNNCPGVGSGSGNSDELAETTLDALISDGATLNVGAVGSLRYCKQAIRAAYFVLRHTYHSFLAGALATKFAQEMGLTVDSLTTSESAINWEEWKGNNCQSNFRRNVAPNPLENCGPYYRIPYDPNDLNPPQYGLNPFVFDRANAQISPSPDFFVSLDQQARESIAMIVIDKAGNTAAGASSNGNPHKVPGRIGSKGIPGAAANAANNIGAAITTGAGDYTMLFSPANTALNYLEAGLSPAEAAQKVVDKINAWYPNIQFAIVVSSITGDVAAACSGMDEFPFTVISDECNGNVVVNRVTCSQYSQGEPTCIA